MYVVARALLHRGNSVHSPGLSAFRIFCTELDPMVRFRDGLLQVRQIRHLRSGATGKRCTLLQGFAALPCRTFRGRLPITHLNLREHNAHIPALGVAPEPL